MRRTVSKVVGIGPRPVVVVVVMEDKGPRLESEEAVGVVVPPAVGV